MTDANTAELTGRRAIVTGASRGIGQAIALRLATLGAHVICASTKAGGCDATLDRIRGTRGSAQAAVVDVADEASVNAFAEATLAGGAPNILVNNAGVTRDGSFLRMSAKDFDAVLATNLRGAFLTCRAFVRAMLKTAAPRIVNVGSVVGLTGNAGQANYAASKAALHGLTMSLAKEFGSRGVTVNTVAPGFIETDMTASLPDAVRQAALATIPLGRFGVPDDIAQLVGFLCGDAGAYITGQVLVVDGGMTL
ncbi:MAG: 3-oxoacyl-ACP reductase FabG [Planctomycetes bacterium]|nr:3-oxoacyl-ACP reductase FabG [Planctomycetota bacterium]